MLRGVSPGADVLADCGRLRAEHAPRSVLASADVVVVVSGWGLRSLRATEAALAELRTELTERGTGADALGLLLVGRRSAYSEAEVGTQLGVPVLGVIPDDARSAEVFSDGAPAGRGVAQSPLVRAVRGVIGPITSYGRARSTRLATAPAAAHAPDRPPAPGRALHAVTPATPVSGVAGGEGEPSPREPAVRREQRRWREPRPMRSPGEARHG